MTQTGAFLLTIAVEVPVVGAGAALARAPRPSVAACAWLALGANALTHPLLWIADARLAPALGRPARWVLLEAGVVVAEAAILAAGGAISKPRAFALALAANAASFTVGLAWTAVQRAGAL